MTKLDKLGKGIILMHDFQKQHRRSAADAARAPQGRRLQGRADEGEDDASTLPEYDEALAKELKLPTVERASGVERGADGFAALSAAGFDKQTWPGSARPFPFWELSAPLTSKCRGDAAR